MGASRLGIRIAGVVSMPHGLAFAVTDGSDRLIDWGCQRASGRTQHLAVLDALFQRSRLLFVAAEISRNDERSARGREFNDALKSICTDHGVMILNVELVPEPSQVQVEPTNYEIACAAVERFGAIAGTLPKRRKRWEGVDDRIGIFVAAGLAAAGWQHFQPRLGIAEQ